MKTLHRTIHPEARVLDAAKGLVEYVASDESLDSYREVIRADGWRFDHFRKNAPFVDSHDYSTIEHLLGKVVDFRVAGRQLVETVQWAVDVAENTLAQIGWRMTQGGYLKAVSVGFWSVRVASPFENRPEFYSTLADLSLQDANVRCVYLEQQQIELSACVIGANPNALARAYKDGALDDASLDLLSVSYAQRQTAQLSHALAMIAGQQARERQAFLTRLHNLINKL
jgi:hypothetical protein